MLAPPDAVPVEHLTPHDLVAYFHCPHEMELGRVLRESHRTGAEVRPCTPAVVRPLRHSPMFSPPLGPIEVVPGRLDLGDGDFLVYEDGGEDDLPVLFPPDRVRIDPRFAQPPHTLHDPELGFAGRPDLVIARPDGALVPLEYKATHLFLGYHEAHGRLFDTIQAIAECRLVEAAFGRRPPYALILYGDRAGDGAHEGFVRIPYTESDERWLRAALAQVRADTARAPVPAERNCAGCEPNGDGRCPYAVARYEGPHRRIQWHAAPRELAPRGFRLK
ncbi:MAG: hypothetical protein QXG65_05705 [Thermoplasmata archaeon]